MYVCMSFPYLSRPPNTMCSNSRRHTRLVPSILSLFLQPLFHYSLATTSSSTVYFDMGTNLPPHTPPPSLQRGLFTSLSFQPSPNLGRRVSKTNPAPPPLPATASVNNFTPRNGHSGTTIEHFSYFGCFFRMCTPNSPSPPLKLQYASCVLTAAAADRLILLCLLVLSKLQQLF